MTNEIIITKADPRSPAARMMMDALWEEIQTRYGFKAPNLMNPDDFLSERAGFWLAFQENNPVGSVALVPLSDPEAELDVMYVAPSCRGSGAAQELLKMLEAHAKENGFSVIKLRAGAPQPEALRFYEKMGYTKTELFGRWINDNTAICYEKKLS